jgi:hypothetical protein
MTALQQYGSPVITPQIREELSQKEIEVYKAAFMSEDNQKVRNMSGEVLTMFSFSLQQMANEWLGLKEKTVDDNKAAIRAIRDALLEYPYLNQEEVIKIVKMGLKGEFRKDHSFVHFSASNLCMWIEEYMQTVKLPVMQRIDYLPEPTQEKPVLSLKEQMDSKFCILYDALEQVATGMPYYDHGDIVYNYLNSVLSGVGLRIYLNTEDTKKIVSDCLKVVANGGSEDCIRFLNGVREDTLEYLKRHGEESTED